MKYNIYRHTNLKNGRSYVGLTSRTVFRRWNEHVGNARKMRDYAFYRALRRHGTLCWKHDELGECDTYGEATKLERYWIARLQAYGSGYNMTVGGDGVVQNQRSEEHRRKLSTVARNRTDAQKERWARVNVGRKHSRITRAKWSALRTGRKLPESTIDKLRGHAPWNKGKKLSSETCRKMSESRTGERNPFHRKHHSPEAIERIKLARKGSQNDKVN